MIIKALILTTLLNGDSLNSEFTITPDDIKIEARRRGGKGNKKRRRGGNGLR